jgi:hypothetical protein
MAAGYAEQSDLRRLLVQVASQVSCRFAVCFRDQHRLRKTPETIFDPSLVEKIACVPLKMLIKIESGVVVASSRDGAKRGKVALASETGTVEAESREIFLDDFALQRHTNINEVEVVRLSQPRSLRIVGIRKQVNTVNAVPPAKFRALGDGGRVEPATIQARDSVLEELRIPFQIRANRIALHG